MNEFTGVVSATSTTTSYNLFNNIDTSNILTMKIDNEEITPVSIYTFLTNGEHEYFVRFNKSITSTYSMFSSCTGLTTLDINKLDASNVTNMSRMFINCQSLTTVGDLSKWDTNKVSDMCGMFSGCTSLTSLDLTNWDISNVTDMSNMFGDCKSLTEVKMGGNPSYLTEGYAYGMFNEIYTTGKFYYNKAYNYSAILAHLPSTWTAVPCTLVNGELIPN